VLHKNFTHTLTEQKTTMETPSYAKYITIRGALIIELATCVSIIFLQISRMCKNVVDTDILYIFLKKTCLVAFL